MAKLPYGKMSVEVTFFDYKYKWIFYEIKLLWEDESIINDSILKQKSEEQDRRSIGSIWAADDEKDALIPVIKKVFDSNKPDYWQPIDPDITIEIYPDDLDIYPPLKSHYKVHRISKELLQEIRERESLRRQKGLLDDDLFVIVVRVDAYNFKGEDSYCNFGASHSCCVGVLLKVTRAELLKFTGELEKEYEAFCKQHNIKLDAELIEETEQGKRIISERIEHPKGFYTGQWIKHFKYGTGRICKIEDDKVAVIFEAVGKKTLDLNYANLKILDQQQQRHIFFDTHPSHCKGFSSCQCCGYPTLDGLRSYETCFLCDWENAIGPHGYEQDSFNADEVLGGPNGNYSLAEARRNFEACFTMFRPDDPSPYAKIYLKRAVSDIRRQLKLSFDRLTMVNDRPGIETVWNEIEKARRELIIAVRQL